MSPGDLAAALARVQDEDLQERCRGVEELAASADPRARDALAGLLAESSWYLRERVVAALSGRDDAVDAVIARLRDGRWYARASACDILGASGRLDVVPDLLAQIEDRNVSLQKSAVRAVRRIAAARGSVEVAHRVAALTAERRRRVVARIGHQEPEWAPELQRALGEVPPAAFGGTEDPPRALLKRHASGRGARAVVRFRQWLRQLPDGGE